MHTAGKVNHRRLSKPIISSSNLKLAVLIMADSLSLCLLMLLPFDCVFLLCHSVSISV